MVLLQPIEISWASRAENRRLRYMSVSVRIFSFSSKIVAVATSMLATAVITRLIKPDQAGVYFLALSIGTGISIALTSGLGAYGIKEIGRVLIDDRNQANQKTAEILGSFFVAASLLVIIALMFVLSWSTLTGNRLPIILVLVAGLWSYLQAVQSFLSDLLRGHNLLVSATLLNGGLAGVIFLFILISAQILGMSKIGAEGVITFYSVGTAISIMAFVPSVINCLRGARPSLSLEKTRLNVSSSWLICINNILIYALLQINLWIIGVLLPMADVALYGAAMRAATALMVANSVFYSLLPPQIVAMHKRDERESLEQVLRRTATTSTILAAPVAIVLIIFPSQSLTLLFGSLYSDAKYLLVPLALANFVNVLTGFRGSVLILTGHERVQLVITIVGALCNLFFCLSGIHYFGVLGAACGTGLSIILQCILETIALKRLVGVWSHITVLKRAPKNNDT